MLARWWVSILKHACLAHVHICTLSPGEGNPKEACLWVAVGEGSGALQPEFRIFPGCGDVVNDQGNDQHDQCSQGHRHRHIEIAKLVHFRTAYNRDQCCGAPWWMVSDNFN